MRLLAILLAVAAAGALLAACGQDRGRKPAAAAEEPDLGKLDPSDLRRERASARREARAPTVSRAEQRDDEPAAAAGDRPGRRPGAAAQPPPIAGPVDLALRGTQAPIVASRSDILR